MWEVPRFSASTQTRCESSRSAAHPESRESVGFALVDSIDDVLAAAFSQNGARTNGRVRPATSQR